MNRVKGAHVYNLTTSTGWYVAQNLLVHNCDRCYSEPVLDDLLGNVEQPTEEPTEENT